MSHNKLSKSEFNFQVNKLQEQLKLEDCRIELVRTHFILIYSNKGSIYELKFEISNQPIKTSVSAVHYFGPIEYIYKDFFMGPDNLKKGPYIRWTYIISNRNTNIKLPNELLNVSYTSRDLFEYCLPYLTKQWDDLQSELKELNNLEYLYKRTDKDRGYIRSKLKKLILAKLLSEKYYKNELLNTRDLLKTEYKEGTINLTNFLDNLDVEKYLLDKPWQSVTNENNPPKYLNIEPNQIYLENTGIIALSSDYSKKINDLARFFGGLELERTNEFELGDVTTLQGSDEQLLNILQLSPTTIIFAQNPDILVEFKEKLTTSEQCLVVMTELETSDSAMISYYKNGVQVLSHTKTNSKAIDHTGDFPLKADKTDTTAIIRELFEKVTQRKYQDLLSNDTGYTYKIIKYRVGKGDSHP